MFSRGHLILFYTRNRLSVESTRAIICLESWSLLNLIKDDDIRDVAELEEGDEEEDADLDDGWELLRIMK